MKLVIYEKPSAYLIVHVLLGVVSAFFIPVLWMFLGYQFLQLLLNKRFFLFEWRIKNGNSIEHTVVKLVEFFVGFLSGKLFQHYRSRI
jgi:hypothetical protein